MQTVSTPTSIALRAKLFRGFSDPSRLAILDTLRAGPRTVGEIVAATGLGQSNTSNHLACLYDCGLVDRTPNGKFVSYQLADPRVGALLDLAEAALADIAERVYACTRSAASGPGS